MKSQNLNWVNIAKTPIKFSKLHKINQFCFNLCNLTLPKLRLEFDSTQTRQIYSFDLRCSDLKNMKKDQVEKAVKRCQNA